MSHKTTVLLEDEKHRLVGESAKRIGISRSDFVRMAINEKLFRLGVLQSDGVVANQMVTDSNQNRGDFK